MSKDDDIKAGPSSGAAGGSDDPDDAPITLKQFLALPENKDATLVVPLQWCPHLETSSVASEPPDSIDPKAPCLQCGNVGENWICLACNEV